jgi:hypothetical protein
MANLNAQWGSVNTCLIKKWETYVQNINLPRITMHHAAIRYSHLAVWLQVITSTGCFRTKNLYAFLFFGINEDMDKPFTCPWWDCVTNDATRYSDYKLYSPLRNFQQSSYTPKYISAFSSLIPPIYGDTHVSKHVAATEQNNKLLKISEFVGYL